MSNWKSKWALVSIIGAVVLAGGVYGVSELVYARGSNAPSITMQEAEEIASKEANGTVDSIELDSQFGQLYYEVDLNDATGDTDVKVNASTGEVIEVKQDRDWFDDDRNLLTNTTVDTKVTEDEASKIATDQTPGTVTRIELDDQMYYEVEVRDETNEYEYKIHAETGEIVEFEKDDRYDD